MGQAKKTLAPRVIFFMVLTDELHDTTKGLREQFLDKHSDLFD